MRPKKTAISKKLPFSDEQIRAKAYQLWQKDGDRSPEEHWHEAVEELKRERLFQPLRLFWRWTGFGEKKLWDFLQMLIFPLVLAVAAFSLQEFSKHRDQETSDEKSREVDLAKYQAEMKDFVKKGLLSTKIHSSDFRIARSSTVMVLQSLDSKRQERVIKFLHTLNLDTLPGKNGILYQAPLSEITLYKAGLKDANLSSADLSSTDLRLADLRSARLDNANLSGASLISANLNNANLSGANLSGANLSGARLSGANLSGANLSGANLSGANLGIVITVNGSSISSSSISGANLSGANLSGANLNGANLNGAEICKTSLSNGTISNINCKISK
jgi:uncharacterized protein YjbI with pentapeptide repeats